ncbi:MAG: 5'-nucleotidase [Bacteroidales bacterium]|jgi:2',3'-cyclic-nucleotide 2'-phosphodiesterase (5'-nucleotidase family)|nr:5'-nucleotidase [Bacteroidales bacterium]MDD3152345.1 5'-nucleotidase [Bacteroidales bacterium]MDD3913048.1 5'-nucleotidase [Bacteroidales bacterium]MDD4632963.1 5'-nucleotidase [Bacteroidales bacterium]
MKIKHLLLSALIILSIISCTQKERRYVVSSVNGINIPMDSSFDKNTDQAVVAALEKYRPRYQAIMDSVIGYSNVFLSRGGAESVLGDFAADVIAAEAERFFAKPVDMGLLNRGGIRTNIPQGNITYGNVFSAFPFDNYLTIITLSGKDIKAMFDAFAQSSPQCISRAKVEIENKKVKSVLINGKPLDENKYYNVATINYLAEGKDFLSMLANYTHCDSSDYRVREAISHYISNNSPINAEVDGRISIK